jgi:hypothetical protein
MKMAVIRVSRMLLPQLSVPRLRCDPQCLTIRALALSTRQHCQSVVFSAPNKANRCFRQRRVEFSLHQLRLGFYFSSFILNGVIELNIQTRVANLLSSADSFHHLQQQHAKTFSNPNALEKV